MIARRLPAPVAPTPPDRIVLEMSIEEATVLERLTEWVGGDASNSARGVTNEIGRALRGAGIQPNFMVRMFRGDLTALPRG